MNMKQTEIHTVAVSLRTTPFGPVAAVWSVHKGEPKIQRIVLSHPEAPATQRIGNFVRDPIEASCQEINALLDRIEGFLNGGDIRFSLNTVRMDLCSAFQQNVLRAEYAIPRGRVSTYRLIAEHVGNSKAARAVGMALASNPFPIVVPCHRAIRSDGALGGYQGGLKMKRSLLEMEGIDFRDTDHVTIRMFYYNNQRVAV